MTEAPALESHQKSLAIFESRGDKAGMASALNNIGRVYRSQGDYARATSRVKDQNHKIQEDKDVYS
jgi:hypothetical protein